jgi:hypothetical protein
VSIFPRLHGLTEENHEIPLGQGSNRALPEYGPRDYHSNMTEPRDKMTGEERESVSACVRERERERARASVCVVM